MNKRLALSIAGVLLVGMGVWVFRLPSLVSSATSNPTATLAPAYPAPVATTDPTLAGLYPPPPTGAPANSDQRPVIATQSALATQLAPMPSPTEAMTWEAQVALAYTAKAQGIPIDALWVVNEQPINYPNLNRQFHTFKIFDSSPNGKTYTLLVDVNTGEVITDTTALDAAEAQARSVKYGKLTEQLYNKIQPLKDNDLVSVLISVALAPGQGMDKLKAKANPEIFAKYPEAKASLEKWGIPDSVPDSTLSTQIRKEYDQIIDTLLQPQLEPLKEALEARGYAPTHCPGGPCFTIELTKQDLLQIVQRQDVEAIDYVNQSKLMMGASPMIKGEIQVAGNKNLWWLISGIGLIILSSGIVIWLHINRK